MGRFVVACAVGVSVLDWRVSEADDPAEREARREPSADIPLGETVPFFGTILLDPGGRLWIKEYVPEYEERVVSWWVLDSDGTFVARASLPDGLVPTQIDEDVVVGVWQDEFEVPYVRVHRIERP